MQPLSRKLRSVYADSCLNMSLYAEEDGGLADLGLLRKAEQLCEGLRREAPGDMQARGFLVIIRRKLADVLTARDENAEASRWRSLALTTARGDPGLFVEIALEYARMLGPIDDLPTKLAPRVLEIRRRGIVDDTIAMLREAAADGFKDAARLRDEPAFARICSNTEFQALVYDMQFPANPFARP